MLVTTYNFLIFNKIFKITNTNKYVVFNCSIKVHAIIIII